MLPKVLVQISLVLNKLFFLSCCPTKVLEMVLDLKRCNKCYKGVPEVLDKVPDVLQKI